MNVDENWAESHVFNYFAYDMNELIQKKSGIATIYPEKKKLEDKKCFGVWIDNLLSGVEGSINFPTSSRWDFSLSLCGYPLR